MPIKVFEPFTRLDASDVNEFLVNKGGYEFSETLYRTTSGSFIKADYPDVRAIMVKVQGGGAGGGGAGATTAGSASVGAGGGGGVYAEKFFEDVSTLAGTVTITIGAGGAGGTAATSGNAGGESSFGTAVVADGGTGGGSRANTLIPALITSAVSVESGTGDFVRPGEVGGVGIFAKVAQAGAGHGGNSLFGAGGRGAAANNAGANGTGYGSGGGGSAAGGSSTEIARNGGAGAAGIVIIELYK
jgi:hypothetical protein